MALPLRGRDFRLLFSGQMASTIGDMFYAVALGGVVTTRFGPAVIFVAAGGLMALSSLFGWLEPEMRYLQ